MTARIEGRTCKVCKNPLPPKYRYFCSKRCRDEDCKTRDYPSHRPENVNKRYAENRDARRRTWRKYTYGLGSIEHFKKVQEEQRGRCAICEESLDRPEQDHDHLTGQLRGALCRKCNTGIGHLEKKNSWLRKALVYLYRWKIGGTDEQF